MTKPLLMHWTCIVFAAVWLVLALLPGGSTASDCVTRSVVFIAAAFVIAGRA